MNFLSTPMLLINKTTLFLLGCLLLSVTANAKDLKKSSPAKAGFESDRLNRIDHMIQGCIDRGEVPGAIAILVKDGKIGYHKAFGWADIASKKPLETDSLVRIASMSKLVTTVAALQLYEKSRFNMFTKLETILPEFKNSKIFGSWDEEKHTFVSQLAKKKIRMNQLFTHTSGIIYPIFSSNGRAGYLGAKIIDAFPGEDITLEENIKRLATVPLAHEPGEKFTYGMNMDVLGRVVEVLDGRPFAQYMREEVFKPIRMRDTGFSVPKNKWNRVASVYTMKNGKLEPFDESVFNERAPNNKPEWWKRNPDKIALGGAGIISTTYDYARFLQMLVNNGDLDGKRILGRKTVEMISRGIHQPDSNSNYAGGLSVSVIANITKHLGPESEGTFNGGGYFYTSFWVDPKEKFFGVLMSQVNPGNSQLAGNFKLMSYAALK